MYDNRAVNQGIFKGKKTPATASKSEQTNTDLAVPTNNGSIALKKTKKNSVPEYISPVIQKEDVLKTSLTKSTSRVTRASSRKLVSEANKINKDLSQSFEQTQSTSVVKTERGYGTIVVVSLLLISAVILLGFTLQYKDIDELKKIIEVYLKY